MILGDVAVRVGRTPMVELGRLAKGLPLLLPGADERYRTIPVSAREGSGV